MSKDGSALRKTLKLEDRKRFRNVKKETVDVCQQSRQNRRKCGRDRLFQVTVKSLRCLPLHGRVERFFELGVKKKIPVL